MIQKSAGSGPSDRRVQPDERVPVHLQAEQPGPLAPDPPQDLPRGRHTFPVLL